MVSLTRAVEKLKLVCVCHHPLIQAPSGACYLKGVIWVMTDDCLARTSHPFNLD
jgi:hypothetical protein